MSAALTRKQPKPRVSNYILNEQRLGFPPLKVYMLTVLYLRRR